MRGQPLDIVVLGLSLSSSWGNGHATTYRALIAGLAALGHRVTFLERDVPWYRGSRDLENPEFCALAFYESVAELETRFGRELGRADAVIVGSYVPEGVAVLDTVLRIAGGLVAFYDIDTPVTLAKLEGGDEEYLAPRQIREVDLYLSFSGGPILDRLRTAYKARLAVPLYCSVDASRYVPTGDPLAWDLGYLGTYSADRQPALERLLIEPARRLPQLRFVVAGPQYPETIAWPANVERIDHLPPSEHAAFYSRQRFTLNVTRASMVAAGWSPSVRLFEAAACGTPVISDPWPGLTDLLPENRAILVARSSDDVATMLTATREARRREIAAAARQRVLGRHTGSARARELASYLRQAATPAGAALVSAGT